MKTLLALILTLSISYYGLGQESKNILYDKNLNVLEQANSMGDLEIIFGEKVIARMFVVRKVKVIEYYTVDKGEFVGFTTDLARVNVAKIPYYKGLKGLKPYLRIYPPKEALERYFEDKSMSRK